MLKTFVEKARRAMRANWKQILYYGGVAAVLCTVALCADSYRQAHPPAAETTSLQAEPAVPETAVPEPEPVFLFPDDTLIVRGYSAQPEWNAILSQYETHSGIDLEFNGETVRSLSDGVICAVGEDSVEIRAGRWQLVYRSMEPDAALEAERTVEAGEAIGMQGSSCRGEGWMAPHVHLEVLEQGNRVDPEEILVKNVS